MNKTSVILKLLLTITVGSVLFSTAMAETIAVIGTGRVGSALGPRFAEIGSPVVYGSRTPASERVPRLVARTGKDASAASQVKAAKAAELIMLAVPWDATEQVIKNLGDLDGKIIMDATNAIDMADDGMLARSVDTSAGELIQSWAPGAHVVKTFNNVNDSVMADPTSIDGPVTVPLAGNNAAAKARVAVLVEDLGFPTVDAGPIRIARVLEGMVVLKLVPMFEGRHAERWEYYFRPHPQESDIEPPAE
ncbi:MAG: NADPH-dependent F420 reductase [Gammaproteobacteria bacterium]